MSVNAINNYTSTANQVRTTKNAKNTTEAKTDSKASSATGFDESGVVYEKSTASTSKGVSARKDHSAIVAQLKADAEARSNQLISIVQQTISQQGKTLGASDSIWSFLAGGDFTVTPEVKAQAQADIAEDGYWGVNQTSDRILDFAKALSGDDPSKADELLNAFKKGFKEATKTWGSALPSISQDTYKAVEEKFAAWKASSEQDA